MQKILLPLLLLVALAVNTHAQHTFDKVRIDSVFNALEGANKFMGSVAISHNGETIYSRATGFSDVAKGRKADTDTRYRIGSISKMFTAAMIFKAVELKKLKLEQPISKYFPKVKSAKTITVAQLLNHCSGIHNFTDDKDYLTWNTQPRTRKQLVDMIAKFNSDFAPGSKYEYSNSNYLLLTFILEDVYKKPFATILNEQIIEPLGLKQTMLGGKINNNKNEAYSYKYEVEWVAETETDMSIPIGAGAVVSTPSDLNRFIEGLFAGKIINAESLKKMTTITDGYGMGCFEMPFYDQNGFGHTGGIDGFVSVLAYFPEAKVSIALTSNGLNYDDNEILIAALSEYFGREYTVPVFTKVILTSEDLDKYLGVYATDIMPLKITISKKGNVLVAQATGQSAFALDATGEHEFTYEAAGVVLEFMPDKKQMVLNQGGGVAVFKREE